MSLYSRGHSRFGYLQAAQLFFQSLLRGRQRRLSRCARFRVEGPIAIQVLEERVLLSGSPLDDSALNSIVISQPVADGVFMLYQNQPGTVTPSDLASTHPLGQVSSNLSAVVQNQPGSFDIVLHYGSQISSNSAAMSAFLRAAQFWESQFTDPVTINIDAEFGTSDIFGTAFGATTLGSTQSFTTGYAYSDIRDALIQDASSDESVTSLLPTVGALTFNSPAGITPYPYAGQTLIGINRANALALGFTNIPGAASIAEPGAVIDASISFNSQFAFDLDNSNGVSAGTYDFEAVALHEIGHALGFVSANDTVDYAVSHGQTGNLAPAPMDLFRVAPGQGANFSTATRIMNTGTAFSTQVFYDGKFSVSAFAGKPGVSGLATGDIPMSTGVSLGDGNQASHFKADDITGVNIGVMDPTLTSGVLGAVTRNDLRVLGLIGWDWKDNGSFSTVKPTVTVTPTATFDTTPALSGTVSESGANVYIRLPGVFGNDVTTLTLDGQLGGVNHGTGSFTLTNSAASATDIVRMDLILSDDPNNNSFGTDLNEGDFVAVSSTSVVGLLTPQNDTNYTDQDVRTRTKLLTLTFNSFNPGDAFTWDIWVWNGTTLQATTADALIGSLVKITYSNGITVTNTLAAVSGNPTAASTTLTVPHYLPTTNNGVLWNLADNLLPTLTVGQTYDVQTLIVDSSGAQATDSSSSELSIQSTATISVSIVKVTDGAEASAPTNGLFRATLSSASPTDTIVNYSVSGTATPGSGNDYTALSGTVTIPAGQLTANITVTVLNDATVEATETVVVTVTSVSGDPSLQIGGTTSSNFQGTFAPVTWFTNFTPGGTVNTTNAPASISVTSPNAGSNGYVEYGHSLTTSGVISFSWSYTTGNGAAADYPQYRLNGVYTLMPGYSTSGSGTQSGTAVIPVKSGDVFYFDMETVDGLGGSATTVFSNFVMTTYSNATLNITDNDTATVSIAKITDGIETSSPTNGLFRVTQTAASSTNTVVSYSIGGTATPGSGLDYTTLTGSVTIPAGQLTADITVAVLNDAIVEATETVVLSLTTLVGNSGITIGSGTTTGFQGAFAPATWTFSAGPGGTVNTSSAPTSISLVSGNSSTSGNTDYTHTVTSSGTISFSWSYSTADGASWDYPRYLINGVATTLPGYSTSGSNVQSGTASIPVTAGSTFGLRMYTVDGAAGAATTVFSNFVAASLSNATVNITDNDSATVTIAKLTDGTETSTPTNGSFRVTQTAVSSMNTVVSYAIAGTATSGSDYTTLTGTATILAGQLTTDITVPVLNDNIVEPTETVVATLTGLTGNSLVTLPATSVSNFQGTFAPVTWFTNFTPGGTVTTTSAPASITLTSPNAGSNGYVEYGHSVTSSGTISFSWSYTTGNGAAADYPQYRLNGVSTLLPGYSTSGSGTQSGTAVIPVSSGDTFYFKMTTADGLGGSATTVFSNFVVTTLPSATVNITDNDSATVTITKITDGAETSTPTNGVFRATLSAASSVNTVLNYIVGGTATPGSGQDYTTLSGTATIPAGQLTVDISVPVLNDALVEGTETVILTPTTLTANPRIAFAGTASNDFQGTFAPATWTFSAGPGGTVNTASAPATISLTSGNSSSSGGTDYTHSITAIGSISFSWSYSTNDGAQWDYPQYLINGVATLLPGYSTSGATSQTGTASIAVNAGDVFGLRMYTVDGVGGAATTVFSSFVSVAISSTTLNITDNDTATVSIAKILDGAETASPTAGKFRVTQTAVSTTDTVVTYSVTGTALPGTGNDYTTLTGTVTILAGQTTADIDVTVLSDAVVEPTETVIVTLTGFGAHDADITLNAVAANRTATVNITDNDTATVSIAKITDGAEQITPVNGLFRVTQTAISSTDTVVTYAVTGTATPGVGNDYSTLTGTVTILAGQTTADIIVSVLNDSISESTETVILTLTGFGSHDADITLDALAANRTATVNIADINLSKVSITKILDGAETDTPTNGKFRVAQTLTVAIDTVINYAITGTATAGGDYTTLTGTVTILAGQLTADIDVTVLNDAIVEGTETVVVTLTSLGAHDPTVALDGVPANLTATVAITDNDTAAVSIAQIGDGAERSTPINGLFRVTQTAVSSTNTVVTYSIAGTATPGVGNDYTTLSGTVTILAGQTTVDIVVPVLNDAITEVPETVILTLTSLGAHDSDITLDGVAANLTATVNIVDIVLATVSVAQIQDGAETNTPTDGKFRLTQTATVATDTVVNYAITGTATNGSDYTTLTGTVTILAGETTADIDVTVLNDAFVEGTEGVVVTLTGFGSHDPGVFLDVIPANVTATVNITDDDTATVSLAMITDGAETNTPTNGLFRVTQTAISSTNTVVNYSITGTAVAGAGKDYTTLTGTVTIPAGQTTADISVPVLNDSIIEGAETVILTLASFGTHDSDITLDSVAANLTATVNITDDDTATVSIVKTSDGAEQATPLNGVFRVFLTAISSSDTVVNYAIGGTTTAGAGNDYTTLTGTVTILAGQTTADIIVPVLNDAIVEGSETVILTLNGFGAHDPDIALDGVAANRTATVTITDNNTAKITLAKIQDGAETNTPTAGKFRVTQSAVATTDTVINYSIAGTATAGSDYTTLTGTVTILAGQTTADIDGLVLNDALVEGAETVIVTLTGLGAHNPSVTLDSIPANLTATVNITDDDTATVSIAKITDGSETNTPTNSLFRVTQTAISSTNTVVNYSIAGTAIAGAGKDYTTLTGTVTILAGQTTADISVPVLNDAIVEGTETVVVTLTTFGTHDPEIMLDGNSANLTATVNITDDDTATVSIAKITDGAEQASPVNGLFRVTQTAISSSDTVVNYSIAGTATPGAGNDYTTLTGTVTILAGQTTADISVPVLNDAIVEGNETVIVTLTDFGAHDPDITLDANPANLTATVTITDINTAKITLAKIQDGAETNTPTAGKFRVTQSNVAVTDTVVIYAMTGTATAGSDYTTLTGTVTILAGQTTADIDVPVLDDALVEGNESVVVTLTGLGAHDPRVSLDLIAANLTATVNITDDDTATVSIAKITDGAETNSPINGVFRVTQTAISTTNTIITYVITGSAVPGAGNDYTTLTGTVMIPAGQTTADINVAVLNDAIVEGTETVVVTLNGLGAHDPDISLDGVSTNLTATVDITDNDTATVSIAKIADGAEQATPTNGLFRVTQTAISTTDTVITYAIGGTATADTDYVALSGTVTIPAGQTTADISVPVLDNPEIEAEETVVVTLTGFTSHDPDITLDSNSANRTAAVKITDNDKATFSINDVTAIESDGVLVFAITTDVPMEIDIVVDVTFTDGTAIGGATDYASSIQHITFLAGQISQTVSVTLNDDQLVEATEKFTAALSTATPLGGRTVDLSDTGTGTITDDDTAVFTLDDVTANESDGVLVFNLSTDTPLDTNVTINVTFTDGTATGGTDYTSTSQQITFVAGQTSKSVSVPLINDSVVETTEAFTAALRLSSAIGDRQTNVSDTAIGTIIDNDAATFTITNAAANESAGLLVFNLSMNNALDVDVTVDVTFTDGTATGGTDYTSAVQHITFLAGQTSQAVILTLTDDNEVEAAETFTAALSTSTPLSGRNVDLSDTGAYTITDNDVATFTMNTVTATETAGVMVFNLTTDKALDINVTIDVILIDGTATGGGTDFSSTVQHVTFVAGRTSQLVSVTLINDNIVEATETFTATMSTASALGGRNITFSGTGTGTITDDDAATISVTPIKDGTETDTPFVGNGKFRIALSAASSTNTVVTYSVGGTSTAGSDYATLSGTATIPAGQTFVDVDVPVFNDALLEGTEIVILTVTGLGAHNPAITLNPIAANRTATVSITDDDLLMIISANTAAEFENSPASNPVLTVAVNNAPTNAVTLSLSGPDAALFKLNSATGQLTFLNSPDFESPLDQGGNNHYDLTVTATDSLVPTHTAPQNLVIIVANQNEAPTVLALSGINTIAENQPAGSPIGTLSTTDPDSGDTFTYGLTPGVGSADNGFFQIVGNQVRTAQPLNFEAQSTYNIRIRTTDSGGLAVDKSFVISATNLNEAPTDIGLSGTTVPENQSAGTPVGTLSSTDPDAGESFTYSLVTGTGSTDNGLFQIVGNALKTAQPLNFEAQSAYSIRVRATDLAGLTFDKILTITSTNLDETPTGLALAGNTVAENESAGKLVGDLSSTDPDSGDTFIYTLVTGAGNTDNALFQIIGNTLRTAQPLNFETQPTYTVRIRTTDSGGLSFENTFTVTATDVNERPTNLNLLGTTVSENQPAGTAVGTFSSADPDAGDSFTYSLVTGSGSTDNTAFQIVGNSLQTAQPLNFEARAVYSIRVRTTDLGGQTFEKTVTITATDVNEAPTDLGLSSSTVAENQPAGTTVGTLSGLDPDSGDSLTFALVAGAGSADNGSFQVVGNSLRTSQPLNFETQATYLIRLRATDLGGLTVEKTLIITATNTNDTPTDSALSGSTVAENLPSVTAVGTLSSTDPDAGDTFTYTLVSGTGSTDNAFFQIVGNTLRTAQPLDFETHAAYSIRVRTTDFGGLTFEKIYTIHVTNVDETPTNLALSASTVAESQPAGSAVGQLSTTDPDLGDTFAYTLVSGSGSTDNARFQIVGNALQTAQPLDFESQSGYFIRIRTTDVGGLSVEKTFTIAALDVNEKPTNLILSADTVTENQPAETTVGTLIGSDQDIGDSLTYSLISGTGGNDNGFFQIFGNTLQTSLPLDFDTQPTYAVLVRVTDRGGLTFDKSFTIIVTNVNEAPTSLVLSAASVAENQIAGTSIGTFSTTDPDLGNTFTYAFASGAGGNDNALFRILGNSLRTSQPLDFEAQPTYSIRVRTTDGEGLTFDKSFTITLTNVNEGPTNQALSAATIAENQPVGSFIGTLSSTDVDAGDTLTYTLVSGTGSNDNSFFQIAGNTLRTSQVLNFEAQSTYSIRVRTTDSGGLNVEKAYLVTATNINEEPTDLTLSDNSIAENQPAGTVIGTLSSTDPDAGSTLTYSLVSGTGDTGNAAFGISGNHLTTSQILDYETRASYSVRVRSTDAGGLSTEQVFTIGVTDTPDAPQITLASGTGRLPNGHIGPIDSSSTVTDQDSTNFKNNRLVVTIQSSSIKPPDKLFVIASGRSTDSLKASRGLLLLGKTQLGTVTGGLGGQPLQITFTADIEAPLVQRLLRQIGLKTQKSAAGVRHIQFQIFDATGASKPPVVRDVAVGG